MRTVLTGKSTETPWPDLSDNFRMLREGVSIKVARNVRKGCENYRGFMNW